MKIINKILGVFFPRTCGFCNKKINERYTCRKCLNIIEYYHEMVVITTTVGEMYCDKIFSALNYEGILKNKMLSYKFHDAKYLGVCFAELLVKLIKKHNLKADIIVAVPISKERLRERGYNQSEVIAKKVSELIGIKYQKNILLKIANNLRQSELSLYERKENVKNVYSIKNIENVKDKKVILIDDIFTTGATLNECAKVLKQSGALEVIALTVMYAKLKE